jgi:hypothetical protein
VLPETGVREDLLQVPLCGTSFHFLAAALKSTYNQSSVGVSRRESQAGGSAAGVDQETA